MLRVHEGSCADGAARSFLKTDREHEVLHQGDPGGVAAPCSQPDGQYQLRSADQNGPVDVVGYLANRRAYVYASVHEC